MAPGYMAALLALALPAEALGSSSSVLIGRGDSVLPFSFAGPGASSLSLSTDLTPWSFLPYLNVSFDFSQGGWTAAIGISDAFEKDLDVPQPLALQFNVFNPRSASLQVNIGLTLSDYSNVGSWPILQPGWNNMSLAFNASDWLPLKNWTLPLRQFSLGAQQSTGPTGWIGFADVSILSAAGPGSIPNAVMTGMVAPLGVGDSTLVQGQLTPGLAIGVQLTNRLSVPCDTDVTVQLLNASGPMGTDGWSTCAATAGAPPMQGWTSLTLACDIPVDSPAGYLAVRAVVNGSSCWTVNDTAIQLEGAVAVVMPQPPVTIAVRNVRPNVFGGQMTTDMPGSAAAIGMWVVRHGPLWRWAQSSECWNESTCFDWSFYDGAFGLAAVGIEAMIDAREIAPPWAAAKNNSGPTWAEFPGPEHYADYQRYLTIMLDRYAGMATAVEVSNEDDGLSYFMPQPIPMNETCIPLSLALVNLTAAAMAASVNASGLKLVGMSSSSQDVKQEGNSGAPYAWYERTILNAPGVINQLDAVSLHPYQNGVWVPWVQQPWANTSFQFANETRAGCNSTVAQLMATAGLMQEAAAAAGISDYKPVLWPSEWGYNLQAFVPLTDGWAVMHAALVAQGLIHMRSAPLSQYVQKAMYFAYYDGCCPETGGFFGLYRPRMSRPVPDTTAPGNLPTLLASITPTPAASAYATASVMLDVPSGRLPGVFVVDNTAEGMNIPPGSTSLPPSCAAFEPDSTSSVHAAPLIVLFILGHHYNDRTAANVTVSTQQPQGFTLLNGLGTPMPVVSSVQGNSVCVSLTLAPLPQYLVLPTDADAEAVCASLRWD